ncbi:unnamed protein product, partial [Rotaria sp. Silwood1]
MDVFGKVYKEVALNYVDEIDADKFVKAGIEGMLGTLDPYTTYYDENSKDQIDLITAGKYGGIGVTIGVRDSTFTITDVMNGYEAQKKGLRVGDKIIELDGKDLSGTKYENTRLMLVDKNSLLLITKGKESSSEKKYFSSEEPLVPKNVPVVVLTNEGTASASEIVAGAVQDLDRGVIVGTKSFGKGLVQQFRDLSNDKQMKITTSKYFTPSGRWIQQKDYFQENKFGVFLDKDKYNQSEFKTLGGRTVTMGYDGKGNYKIDSEDEIVKAIHTIGSRGKLMCERFVPFQKEIAVQAVRNTKGDFKLYPIVETIQENHVCTTVLASKELFSKLSGQVEATDKTAIQILPETSKTTKIIPVMQKDTTPNTSRDYLKLHYDAIVVDSHNDFIWQ